MEQKPPFIFHFNDAHHSLDKPRKFFFQELDYFPIGIYPNQGKSNNTDDCKNSNKYKLFEWDNL